MITKYIKLSDALADLPSKQGEKNDKIIVSSGGKNYGIEHSSMLNASKDCTGLMSAEDKTYIETLKPLLRGSLGNFESSEAFNNYLNGLSYDTLKSGRYVVYLGGVPFFVTFSQLCAKEQISAVWVEGSLMVSDNAIGSNTGEGVTIAYRYYKNGAWEAWKTIYDDVRTDIPTAQTSVNGTTKNYIYSTNDRESTYTVLSGKIWMYTHTDRNLFLRFKNWGAENDTNATNYNQVLLCYLVNRNQDGLMDKYVLLAF